MHSEKQFVLTKARRSRLFGILALIGASTFFLSLAALHAMSSGIDWVNGYVSDLANEPHGLVFGVGAFVHGWGNLALSLGLYYALPAGRLRNWGVLFLGLAAIGIMLTGLFPIDPPGAAASFSGSLHRPVSSTAFILEIIALLIFSLVFTSCADPRWRRLKTISWVLTVAAIAAVIWFSIADVSKIMVGLSERAALGALMVWEIRVIFQLVRPIQNNMENVRSTPAVE